MKQRRPLTISGQTKYNSFMSSMMFSAARLPWPTRWDEMYGRSAPLLLEIGFGGGHFLVDWAKRRPDANVLGLEISLPSLRRAAKKIETSKLTNVRLVQGNAWLLLQAACAPGSVSEIQI
ncbi:MAG: methyltransferase domain-containing protein, partial [Chloroflexi bacterium]|nr:methyltransferase domain-containing protein [Chloroflexota bacterium]